MSFFPLIFKSLFGVLIFALLLLALLVAVKRKVSLGSREKPKKKFPLTAHEQVMYNRLVQALPDLTVLAQVSFNSLLHATSPATRNMFNRKVADFVVCGKGFQVIAVIELDDSSHKGKEARDARRDEMLEQAGYLVLRYPRVPDVEVLRAAFAARTR